MVVRVYDPLLLRPHVTPTFYGPPSYLCETGSAPSPLDGLPAARMCDRLRVMGYKVPGIFYFTFSRHMEKPLVSVGVFTVQLTMAVVGVGLLMAGLSTWFKCVQL